MLNEHIPVPVLPNWSTWNLWVVNSYLLLAIDKQELLLHEQTVSDDGPHTAGSQEFGDRG
jgi:hypothetical protein